MASSTSCSSPSLLANFTKPIPTFTTPTLHFHSSTNSTITTNRFSLKTTSPSYNEKWRCGVSFLPSFLKKGKDVTTVKEELLEAIFQTDRGADATPQDQARIDKMTRDLEALNPTKAPLKSDLLNGKWELLYTTSVSILQTGRPKFLRSRKNYQAINVDTLRAQNMESWPFFNQVTADLMPLNARKVGVKFDYFKILGLIPVKAPERAVGQLEITYLDEDLRVSRGDKGNLFILQMLDPSYRVPV